MKWTMDTALCLIRQMQSGCMKHGYYVALAGSVLNNGQSDNDLDLVLVPMSDRSKRCQILEVLHHYLGRCVEADVIPCGVWRKYDNDGCTIEVAIMETRA